MGMNFAEMHPELASEFSERNLPLMASDITYGSNKKYWWSGKCGHEWLASPKSRHSGEGCPYCAGMRVLEGFNDLASIRPELVDEWSSENEPLKPNNVNAASHRKVKWKGKCGHEWTAEIRARVKGTGCPYCSNNKIMPGFNDLAMKAADKVVYTSQDYYSGCMHKRNRHLVDNSSRCICFLTEKTGGTFYTVNYASEHGLMIINTAK